MEAIGRQHQLWPATRWKPLKLWELNVFSIFAVAITHPRRS
jgi:hypothetical protein